MSNEIQLLLVGAGIAFVSSILTTVITLIITRWLDSKDRKRDKLEQAYLTIGEYSALYSEKWGNIDPDVFLEMGREFQGILKDKEMDQNLLAGLMGFMNATMNKHKPR